MPDNSVMKPIRIQRKRTKGWKMPPNTIYVGRPTKWGNPFRVGEPVTIISRRQEDGKVVSRQRFEVKTVARALKLYEREYICGTDLIEDVDDLRGKNLACFCPLNQPCHADVLLKLANEDSHV